MTRILMAAMFCLVAAVAQAAEMRLWGSQSAEWQRGWCDAVKAVMANRDHYRALVRYPAETHEQSMARIYEKWPPRLPDGFAPSGADVVDNMLNLEMAGIDLYVVLPPQPCAETK